ncbi:YfhO family protein [Mangrovimonas aestuarii]|uniref:YfhO family protein n=1 Tax=Mangrovimonas aestuarii TaxID=3018443 RepID=UPI002379B846|nr:YfhO family protein [Mangrovimonas aestuarii]
MQFSFKRILPHLLVLVGFVFISLAYFSPVLQGESIFQSDIVQYIGMSKQQTDFRVDTGEETYWTNSAFGGMPTYQLGAKYPHNYIKKLDLALRFLPRPADYLFLYLLGFYLLMLTLKVNFKLSALGAVAFGFSTYLIIILGVGHNAKAHAIAYMPLVISGILLVFQKRYLLGFLVTAIAMGLELCANHFQMTYYLLLLVIVLGIVYLIDAYKKKELNHFFKSVGVLIVAVVLALGMNATNIMATQEYVKESTRGKSELTINSDGSLKDVTNGLSRDYITEYSYGIVESLNLFIPRFTGGGNHEDVGKDSETYQFYLKQGVPPVQAKEYAKQTPTYWGNQPIVEAPAYIGAVVLFLFVLALFLVKGRTKQWLVAGTILSLLLSYGKNLGFLTDLFIDYFPMYNKFRAVSSIQVILELCIPVLAVMGLVKLFSKETSESNKINALKWSTIITGGVALLFLVLKSALFDFVGGNDGYYRQAYGPMFIEALRADRQSMFTSDTIRTLAFVLFAAGLIFGYLRNKLKSEWTIIGLGVLICIDLIGVDRRYVNNDDFVPSIQMNKPYQANAADIQIQKDTTHFRVLDLTSGAARASYFHNSLGGYHAAKMRRFNELNDFYISKNKIEVLNMLNTKYIIAQEEDGTVFPYVNEEANGNAWLVENVIEVTSANEELLALDTLQTKRSAVVFRGDKTKNIENTKFKVDSSSTIDLTIYKPNYLKYNFNSLNDAFVVFSENYYGQGWQAYLDGNPVDHYRVDYVLRGMEVPKGKHEIEFKFEAKVVQTGSTLALASTAIFVLLGIGCVFLMFKSKAKP